MMLVSPKRGSDVVQVAGRNSDGVTGDASAASSPLLVQSATDKLTLDQNQ